MTRAELQELAVQDAVATFLEEQSAEWYYNVCGTPEPRKGWLKLNFGGEGQVPEEEWNQYRAYYLAALGRGLAHLRKNFNAVWDLPEDEIAEASDALCEACITIIESSFTAKRKKR